MSKYLLQLKKEFGRYGSWALWDKNGGITSFIGKSDFELLIKPGIVFVGLNASMKLPQDWINYHSECGGFDKIKSWHRPTSHIRKLAEVLCEKEFETFKGAYMTDIIKNHYDADSAIVSNKIKQDSNLISENLKLLERELEILSQINGSDNFHLIAMGNKVFEIIDQISKYKVDKIWHYAAYQLGNEGVKEKIRQDLRTIIKNVR